MEGSPITHAAGLKVSAIFLLGADGTERSSEHARASAALATAMDPEFLAALTLTVVPDTPLSKTMANSGWELPDVEGLLEELRIFLDKARPTNALFRTNHASNDLPLGVDYVEIASHSEQSQKDLEFPLMSLKAERQNPIVRKQGRRNQPCPLHM